ncbi:nucleotide-binding universal stress UspA family protein [Rheinheimera pacifica]|uniref:hypothetical protein n=1 Tax=Rheinheimera pacifica TaxID=173990 RepID=UPI0021694F8A|nr:hypothetical protein [Rheinheimera pacifica]MCS4306854.1 nucleotide-binding universal stress UspA family protein [Rheinheimera pacifica]
MKAAADKLVNIKLQDTRAEPSDLTLGEINQLFHRQYAKRKQHFVDIIKHGHILLIVRMDSRLIACCGTRIEEFIVNGPGYHRLKALSHSTMAVYYTLQQTPQADAAALLNQLLTQLKCEADNVVGQLLFAATQQLLNAANYDGTLDHGLLLEYSRKLEPVFAQLMLQSATDETTQLLRFLDEIAEQFGKAAADTFFVVFGGPQARYRQLTKQVFENWCQEAADIVVDTRHHVRYYEHGTTLADAVNLIATALADRELAQTFLGHADALDQDVLAVVAQQAIKRGWRSKKRTQ